MTIFLGVLPWLLAAYGFGFITAIGASMHYDEDMHSQIRVLRDQIRNLERKTSN